MPTVFAANKDSMAEASIQRSIRVSVQINEDESNTISLTKADSGYLWNAKMESDKEFEFSPEQIIYLKESIYLLSKSNLITQDLLPIGEKIYSL